MFQCHSHGGCYWCQLVEAEVVVKILCSTEQSQQHGIVQLQISIAPSLGIPDLKYNDEKNEDKFLIENNERKHALQM